MDKRQIMLFCAGEENTNNTAPTGIIQSSLLVATVPYHPSLPLTFPITELFVCLLDVEELLQLHNKLPLVLANIASEEFLERIDTLPADSRVKHIVFFQMATVHGLTVGFDLDGNRRLSLFADLHRLVIALDGCTVDELAKNVWQEKMNLHSSELNELPGAGGGVLLDCADRCCHS